MKIWLIGLISVVCAIGVAADRVELNSEQIARAGIETEPVIERGFGDQQRVVGQVVRSPGSTINLKALVPGRVEDIRVAPGDRVRRGQIVAQLHSHEILAMQGELLRERERSLLAEKRLGAGKELFSVDGISRIDLEVREQEAFSARLEFEMTYEELVDHGLSESGLDRVIETRKPDAHLPIVSPAEGVVLEVGIQPQEWVREYASIMVIGDEEKIELEIQIPPDRATQVKAGDIAEFYPVGRPDQLGRAAVITRVPQVDPTTRTIRIRAKILDRGHGLFPGVFVEGALAYGETRTAPSIPGSAVINVGGQSVVFVVDGPEAYRMRPVVLGRFTGDRYEITSGLEKGEAIAVQGVFFLKSAMVKGEGEEG